MRQKLDLQFESSPGSDLSSLEEFRLQIEGTALDTTRQLYTLRHPHTSLYKGIFCTLGVLMILLSLTVFFKSSNWILELHVGYGWFLKAFIGSFAAVIGIGALALGFRLQTEKDVAYQIWISHTRKLFRLYRCKLSGTGGARFFFVPANREQSQSVRKDYLTAKEQLHNLFEKNQTLLRQIDKATFIKLESREQLFNQALAEFHQEADSTVRSFALSDRKAI